MCFCCHVYSLNTVQYYEFYHRKSIVIYSIHLVTYPLDVIRRRMQLKGSRPDMYPYTSTLNAVAVMYRTEGMGAFYKGMFPNLLKVAPSMGVAFVTYEFVKTRLYALYQ